jgi:hypothetical protein
MLVLCGSQGGRLRQEGGGKRADMRHDPGLDGELLKGEGATGFLPSRASPFPAVK